MQLLLTRNALLPVRIRKYLLKIIGELVRRGIHILFLVSPCLQIIIIADNWQHY